MGFSSFKAVIMKRGRLAFSLHGYVTGTCVIIPVRTRHVRVLN